MCRVNKMQTRLFRITTSELLQRPSLSPTDVYVSQRKLHWTGHVMRMSWDYLPRKMISKRPKGYPNLTYDRSLQMSLDRDGWRDIINNIPLVFE